MNQYQTLLPYLGFFPPPSLPLPAAIYPVYGGGQSNTYINDSVNVDTGTNPSPVYVTQVTTPIYNIVTTDYLLCVDTSANAVTLTLPVGLLGTVYIIKDCAGNAAVNNITITSADIIDGVSNALINIPYGSITVIFTGTEWSIV